MRRACVPDDERLFWQGDAPEMAQKFPDFKTALLFAAITIWHLTFALSSSLNK
jgi:hypothetical protein